MALAKSRTYKRSTTDQAKYGFKKLFTGELRTLVPVIAAAPAAGAALPAPGAVVQQFTSIDEFQTACACSGTLKQIGSLIGILGNDTPYSDTNVYYVEGGNFKLLEAAGQTFAVGAPVFVRIVDMLAYDSGGAGYIQVGYVATDQEGNFEETNPANLPAGTYVHTYFNQIAS